jgi:hypothetical protein
MNHESRTLSFIALELRRGAAGRKAEPPARDRHWRFGTKLRSWRSGTRSTSGSAARRNHGRSQRLRLPADTLAALHSEPVGADPLKQVSVVPPRGLDLPVMGRPAAGGGPALTPAPSRGSRSPVTTRAQCCTDGFQDRLVDPVRPSAVNLTARGPEALAHEDIQMLLQQSDELIVHRLDGTMHESDLGASDDRP